MPGPASKARGLAAWFVTVLLVLCWVCWFAPVARSATAAREEPTVLIVPLHGEIDEVNVALVLRAIREAREAHASHLVLSIDTPGGRVDHMDRIVAALEEASTDLSTVAFVEQRATSAGSLIAMSCKYLFMTPGANIGSAYPIIAAYFPFLPLDETLQKQLSGVDEAKFEKILADLRAHFRAKAQRMGRNEYLAEAMVDPRIIVYEVEVNGVPDFVDQTRLDDLEKQHGKEGVRVLRVACDRGQILNLTAIEAREARFSDGVTPTLDDALKILDVENAPRILLSPSWSERLASFANRYSLALLCMGLLAIFIEIKVPGFGLPGIFGILCLGLLLFGKYLSGLAEMSELLLIVVGLLLIAAELFLVPGTFVCGVLGVLALVAGLVLSFQSVPLPGGSPSWIQDEWWRTLERLGFAFGSSIIAMFFFGMFLPRIPILNRIVLKVQKAAAPVDLHRDKVYGSWAPAVGDLGQTVTPLRPAGRAEFQGRTTDVLAEGEFVDSGRRVQVMKVQGNRIVVRGQREVD